MTTPKPATPVEDRFLAAFTVIRNYVGSSYNQSRAWTAIHDMQDDFDALLAERDEANDKLAIALRLYEELGEKYRPLKAHADAMAHGIEHARDRSEVLMRQDGGTMLTDDVRLQILGSACAALLAYRGAGK